MFQIFPMTPKTLNSILGNSLVIDFIEITLTQQRKSSPIIYSGPGSISQDENGQLHLKMYHTISPGRMEIFGSWMPGAVRSAPGKLINPESQFRLDATDMRGDTWNSENISFQPSLSLPSVGIAIKKNLRKITHTENATGMQDLKSSVLFFAIPGKYNIPVNESQIRPDGARTLNTCKMNLNGIELQLQKEDNYIIIQALNSDGEISADYGQRILEALSIALGNWLRPVCSIRRIRENSTIEIHNKKAESDHKIHIPIYPPASTDAKSLENFLNNYLFKFKDVDQRFFGYWRGINSVWQSGYVHNQALVTSVAIEGIIKEYYLGYGMGAAASVDQKKKQNRKTKPGIVIDILHKMARDGIFEKQLAHNWYELRNDSAHADTADRMTTREGLQNYLDKLDSCLHLFHILLFHKIGYTGNYVNYSKDGCPLDSFPRKKELDSSETDEES
ncbi:MAG: hypothetical protein OXU53_06680 [Deltaproteobacteria bacterium]|nr:hypothetical protein [Deltaproteobacteria bacterium]